MKNEIGGESHELFKTLYQKYFRKVVRFFVRAFNVSEEDAQDLAQDAFIRFYRAISEYRGDAEWAYLERIARNVGLNRVRTMSTRRRGAFTVDLDDPEVRQELAAPAGPDFAERQQLADRLRRLHEAIAQLPVGQQQCIQLRLDGFKYDEIARCLRISLDAVRSRLRDALRTLRAKLGDETTLPEDEQ